ncbi:uncharacterized protein LACBIDRAFT_313961 [Laccaria bicolor S238N-H82]|uniref:Predicted protein n=1 Tax=Laccaria bicolor (strain S238N-H82 / ATCC MYA-4686) TaxID=486041 RepID=B0D190_LACBS|nr:uncharacterized protein LACBIDRAFT_313961 [Laccaria bicolor S238N-H82]EDR11592.1 predicted protein [Laccaria bicolor S238N-H82]|eukprot:XP_001877489.1 predicted protein [Laccaria bicolor S238N-H82]
MNPNGHLMPSAFLFFSTYLHFFLHSFHQRSLQRTLHTIFFAKYHHVIATSTGMGTLT